MEQLNRALRKASPKVVSIIIIGWVVSTFLEQSDATLMDVVVLVSAMAAICAIYFIAPDILKRRR